MKLRGTARGGSFFALSMAALGIIQFYHPARAPTRPFANIAHGLTAGASINAFGTSREVKLRFALPGDAVDFPLEVTGDPAALSYTWINAHDSTAIDSIRPIVGSSFEAPVKPGFYHLAIVRGLEREVIPEPTLAVMVPFKERVGGMLHGYRIGMYVADRLTHHDHPDGFLEVAAEDVDLRVSTHLRLGDFITHDAQADVWPKYVALNPRILDKLELVFAKIGSTARFARPDDAPPDVAFDVHSGFRTPAHNAGIWRAAGDSRHEYGDAADLAIDANGDGRVTLTDELLVARAVDLVELEHPELVGGLGLYTSRSYRTPYVHIDARGERERWRG
ncbi:MAG: hypothetical protein ACREPM_07610 [Gemmatimonadaceae bacterium]